MNFESIRNYYEQLVIDEVMNTVAKPHSDQDFLEDVTCLALNKLPPRYLRHEVDMAFYLTSSERQQMHDSVASAVREAADYVSAAREQQTDSPRV